MSTTFPATAATALQRVALTILIALAAVAITLIPGAADLLQYDQEAIAAGQVWRALTGHLTHWDHNQLMWDLMMFVTLGAVVEPRSGWRFTLLCLVSAIGISGGLWWRHPELATYRGLSGIDTALFVYMATELLLSAWRDRRLTPGLVSAALLIGFLAKLGYEMGTGQTLFVDSAASGFAVVTLAHSIGAWWEAALPCVPPQSIA